MSEKKKPLPIEFEVVGREKNPPVYANILHIHHTQSEFVFEFGYVDTPTANETIFKGGNRIEIESKARIVVSSGAIHAMIDNIKTQYHGFIENGVRQMREQVEQKKEREG